MNIQVLGYTIHIDSISIIEIIALYLLIFFFIKYILLRPINSQIKIAVCAFILTILILESLSVSITYKNVFMVKYRNIIYLFLLLVFFSVFQPELRYLTLKIFDMVKKKKVNPEIQNNIIEMLKPLKEKGLGALLVIQNSVSVEPYLTSYTELDSKISPEILQSIFAKTSVLHDGAVIILNGRIKYARAFFKFTETTTQDSKLGARHRTAIYISTQTDADVYVLSEERGTISHCKNGVLVECKL